MLYLNPPHLTVNCKRLVENAMDSGYLTSLGRYVDEFEEAIGDYLEIDKNRVLVVNSGTSALHLSLLVSGISFGDLVLVPNLTFAATMNAVRYVGAKVMLADVDLNNWNLSVEIIKERNSYSLENFDKPLKAVILVSLYGIVPEYSEIIKYCAENKIIVIEDAAESLGSKYMNSFSGCFGAYGVFSFNGNKIITTSGGGALICPDADARNRALHLSNQAKLAKNYYDHDTVGYNYRMSNILAALGISQLEDLENRIIRKREIFNIYIELFEELGLSFIAPISHGSMNYWLSCFRFPELKNKSISELINTCLHVDNIENRRIWSPLNSHEVNKGDFKGEDFPNSESIYENGICLNSNLSISYEQQLAVAKRIKDAHQG